MKTRRRRSEAEEKRDKIHLICGTPIEVMMRQSCWRAPIMGQRGGGAAAVELLSPKLATSISSNLWWLTGPVIETEAQDHM